MIRIAQLKLNAAHKEADLRREILRKLRIPEHALIGYTIRKQSIDARKKDDIVYVYTVDVSTDRDSLILKKTRNPHISMAQDTPYLFPEKPILSGQGRPIVIGSGPAGLFAAYYLAKYGFCPIIIERGAPVQERQEDVERFWKTLQLDPESNIQFGEGGAGTFSDGKLQTGVNDLHGRNALVLQTFVENGAPEQILYMNKPHLGTDLLRTVVANMRRRIEGWGGEYHFHTRFTQLLLEDGKAVGVRTQTGKEFFGKEIILAIGHSARDTYDYIIRHTPLEVVSKPFAVGVRVEHRQKAINRAQYGEIAPGLLPPADYKLTYKSSSGRSVYSFCMCPGGYVVNSSSESDGTCINGMSYSARDAVNANAAIVVGIHPCEDPLQNIAYTRELEEKAYKAGQGRIVSQLFSDFEANRESHGYGSISPCHKGETVLGNIREILPVEICKDICEAMHAFGKKIKDFDAADCILSAVESRTSSPVRILRNEQMEANIRGVYPIGEGAGYAGGITSAAMDGIKVFEVICRKYLPDKDHT